ncbi:hypothetical protein PAPYR_3583 [Paratrimastix pyriformis]|uniref:Uncharacterized protein n=1 Tax=Paratrimastix pyriformis TaxID=342808 RepID=A0ABQ8ULY6_9EUKA|nr:hypothetical protein PAPYR_3583 [Paratrimastix pyriformis]
MSTHGAPGGRADGDRPEQNLPFANSLAQSRLSYGPAHLPRIWVWGLPPEGVPVPPEELVRLWALGPRPPLV